MSKETYGMLLVGILRLGRSDLANVLSKTNYKYQLKPLLNVLTELFPKGFPPPDPTAKFLAMVSFSEDGTFLVNDQPVDVFLAECYALCRELAPPEYPPMPLCAATATARRSSAGR